MEKIEEGFDVFVHDGEKAFGAVRQVRQHDIVIYVENAGDFTVPLPAIKDVYSEKVILDSVRKLDTAHSGMPSVTRISAKIPKI